MTDTTAQLAAARIREALEAGPTPGPWITKKHANIPGVITGGTVRHYVNGSGQDQIFMVCTVQEDNGGDAAQVANAMLVAACSPEALRALLAERDALLKLARYGDAMLHWHRGDNPGESGDVDAITCEEEAVRCGVLEGRNVDEPCCDGCVCAPFVGWEVCYFVPDDVSAARAALTNKD